MDRREPLLQGRKGLGVPDAGHHVLALGVEQEIAVLARRSGRRVTGEAHPGPRVVVPVPEHHGLHVDGRPEVVWDALPLPVGDGPGTVPGGEHRFDGTAQLLIGVLGKRLPGGTLDDLLVGVDQVAEELDRDAGVRGGPGQLLGRIEEPVELVSRNVQDDAAVHGHEPPVGVVGEPLVVGLLGQTLDRLVVEAEVENGVHHPRHRELGSRPHRHQKGVARVADPLAHRLLEPGPGPGHLTGERIGPTGLHVASTRGGADGEARWHGQAEHRRHLGQVGSLAAQEVLHLHGRLAVSVVEVEDEWHSGGVSWDGIRSAGTRSRPTPGGKASVPGTTGTTNLVGPSRPHGGGANWKARAATDRRGG